MTFSHRDHGAPVGSRAVETCGGRTGGSGHDAFQLSSPASVAPDLRVAAALLDAATRMNDSTDPVATRHVIAAEALQLLPADGVILLAEEKYGLAALCHLTRTGSSAGTDTSPALCLQLAADRLLVPGMIPAAELERVQQLLAGGVQAGHAAPTRWRSALVADLDPRRNRPTRLLWYAMTSGALVAAEEVAVIFARHAGLALGQVTERHNLERAVDSRTTTGQAAGILMNRYRITAEQAFGILRRHSQEHNLKLHDVAESVNRTGELSP